MKIKDDSLKCHNVSMTRFYLPKKLLLEKLGFGNENLSNIELLFGENEDEIKGIAFDYEKSSILKQVEKEDYMKHIYKPKEHKIAQTKQKGRVR